MVRENKHYNPGCKKIGPTPGTPGIRKGITFKDEANRKVALY